MLKIVLPVGVPSAVIALMSIFLSVRAHSEPAKKRYYQARGIVSDQVGNPIAGATVYILNEYHSSSNVGRQAFEVTTDDEGTYAADGLRGSIWGGHTTVVAFKSGKPPTFRRAVFFGLDPRWPWADWCTSLHDFRQTSATVSRSAEIERGYYGDLVIPDNGATVRIAVLHHNVPAVGVWIRMAFSSRNSLVPRSLWAGGGWAPSAALDHLHPVSMTGADGVAAFENLIPGKYTATLIRNKPRKFPGITRPEDARAYDKIRSSYPGFPSIEAQHEGIFAASGLTRNYSMVINPQYRHAFFRPVRPSGAPTNGETARASFHQAVGPIRNTSDFRLDQTGAGELQFPTAGLWNVRTRVWAGPSLFQPGNEPYDEGNVLVAVSSLLMNRGVARIHTIHRAAASLRVKLTDTSGAAQIGQTYVCRVPFGKKVLASAFFKGETLFQSLPSGRYFVHAMPCDEELPSLADPNNPPDDHELTNRIAYPYQQVFLTAPDECEVLLKARKVGYLKGKVEFQRPDQPGSIWLYHSSSSKGLDTRMRFDRETGEFVCGPLIPGEVELSLKFFSRETFRDEVIAYWTADVSTDRVNKVTGPGRKPTAPETQVRSSAWTHVSGTVFLNGGEPAYGAQILKYVSDHRQTRALAITDVLGRFRTIRFSIPVTENADTVDEPVLIVQLPGSCGVSIVSLNATNTRDLTVVLPPALSLTGRVTVGGKPPTVLPAKVQVLARIASQGNLSHVMDVSTTANHDGTFTLHGMTPGTYKIQASLDSIWVSESTSMEIGEADPISGPVSLDISQPGGPAVLRFVDTQGHPAAEEDLVPTLPSGPLTDSIWPKVLKTDVEGYIRLEGFPEGPMNFTLRGQQYAVDIPPLLAAIRPTQKFVVAKD